MAEDFAVLDFALVDAPAFNVARALAAADASAGKAPDTPRRGILGRLLGRGSKAPPAAASPLLVQPRGTLPQGVLAREMVDDMGFGGADREARVSAPVGESGLTLIELRERTDGAPSPRLLALSGALRPQGDIFAFRLSGGRHPGGEFGFVVYHGGAVTRQLRMFRPGPEDDWVSTERGTPHPLEAEVPPETDDPSALVTPTRLAGILEALGIDADRLLVDRSGHGDVIELSTRPGGTPPDALPDPAAAAPPTTALPQSVTAWEDEVTELLVGAVSDALPEEEQVPWLDAMTADLEAGRTEAALDRARELLSRGRRPAEQRTADAARLAALFDLPG